jgi:YD repeat-containing protein
MATGWMFLTQTDLNLPGTLPLGLSRQVASGYRTGWWFGPSWASTIDQRLEIDAQGVVFVTEDGRLLSYAHPADPDSPTLPETGPRWPLRRLDGGGYLVQDPASGLTRHFGRPADGLCPLLRIADRHGNAVEFDYAPDGAPAAIRHTGGYHVRITTEGRRVTALHLVGADRLTSVTTPDGTVWRYAYDPMGRRMSKTKCAADGVTPVEVTRFVWDGEVLTEQTTVADDQPHPVTLTWDHDGLRPLAQTERITDTATREDIDSRFFAIVTDIIGAPTELVDEAGTVSWRSRRTTWGVTAQAADSTAFTPLRFSGQYHDPETGSLTVR